MKRITVWKLMMVVAVLAVLLGVFLPIGKQAEWSHLNHEIFEAIGRMRPSNPASVGPVLPRPCEVCGFGDYRSP